MDEKPPAPIKVDLFHFATIRTPQLIGSGRKRLGYVEHPDPSASYFLKDLPGTGIRADRQFVRAKADTFESGLTRDALIAAAPRVYALANWLAANRNSLSEADLSALPDPPEPLPQPLRLRIWDTLFLDLVRRANAPLRQACIQVLLADNVLTALTNAASRAEAARLITTPRSPGPPPLHERFTIYLRRLANGRLVIPPAFSVARKTTGPDTDKPAAVDLTPGLIDLKNQHIQSASDLLVDNYAQTKRELQSGIAALPGPERDLQALADSTEAQAFLSPETISFLGANQKKGVTLRAAHELIDGKIRAEYQKAARLTTTPTGFDLPGDGGRPELYSFVVSVDQVEGELRILLTLYTGYPGAFARSFNYSASLDDGAPIKGSGARQIETGKLNCLTLRLFPDQKIKFARQSRFDLKGQLKLNRGDNLSIHVEGALNAAATHGQAQVVDHGDPAGGSDAQEGQFFGVRRVGIGVLRKVEQEVCCYVPGEVSRIENVMAREYKERSTRSLLSSETTTEDTTELQVEDQNDTVSTTRNELAAELASQLENTASIGAGASLGVTAKLGPASVTADGYFDYASSTSSADSDSQSQSYSEELTSSALQKVTQNTTSKRTSRILSEYEENNRHGYDNRKGDEHVTGVYRWVDIIYTNRIINYGKRAMYEFLVPEPARFYRKSLKEKNAAETNDADGTSQDVQPRSLADNGINSPSDIDKENYLGFGRLYGVTLPAPVEPITETITKSFGPADDPNGDEDPDAKERSYQFRLDFGFSGLTNYSATHFDADFNFDYHLKTGGLHTETGTYFILKVYNSTKRFDKDNLSDSDGTSKSKSANKSATLVGDLPDVKDGLTLSVEIKNVYNFAVTLVVTMRLDEQETINWQNAVYDALEKAYQDQLAAYEDAQAQSAKKAQAQREKPKGSSPADNRVVEKRELQRVGIEMLTAPFDRAQGLDFYYRSGRCNVPQVRQTRAWEAYSSQVKFFEQAFEWKQMAYLFYPYYWSDKCSWIDLLQESEANDPVFAAFLQSGMARMVVPVRRGFEDAVNYYMETGDIWGGGGLVLASDDDLYLSIAEELQEIEGVVGREWQTRVPTTLTIIQGNSVFLEDQALPCCNHQEQTGTDTRLRPSIALLGGPQQTGE